MEFSKTTIRAQRTEYFEEETDSDLAIVFISGPFSLDVWKNQFRYFSKKFSTVGFSSEDGYESGKKVLQGVLDDIEKDAVLVAFGLGNALAQSFEYHERVVGTVLTGIGNPSRLPPRRIYRLGAKALESNPKLLKKMLFADITDYSVVRSFSNEVKAPSFGDLKSYIGSYDFKKPVKNSLIIHGDQDRFSSLETARKMKPEANISLIQNAGTFSFYEKPQEYNKALLDFLNKLEGFVEKRETGKARKKNRSLEEFEQEESNSSLKDFEERKAKVKK